MSAYSGFRKWIELVCSLSHKCNADNAVNRYFTITDKIRNLHTYLSIILSYQCKIMHKMVIILMNIVTSFLILNNSFHSSSESKKSLMRFNTSESTNLQSKSLLLTAYILIQINEINNILQQCNESTGWVYFSYRHPLLYKFI